MVITKLCHKYLSLIIVFDRFKTDTPQQFTHYSFASLIKFVFDYYYCHTSIYNTFAFSMFELRLVRNCNSCYSEKRAMFIV